MSFTPILFETEDICCLYRDSGGGPILLGVGSLGSNTPMSCPTQSYDPSVRRSYYVVIIRVEVSKFLYLHGIRETGANRL